MDRSTQRPSIGSKVLRDLESLSIASRSEFGGKAALLGEMSRLGITVLPGLAISSSMYTDTLHSVQPIMRAAQRLSNFPWPPSSEQDRRELDTISSELDAAFQQLEIRDLAKRVLGWIRDHGCYGDLIVRSSATAEDSPSISFAGQFASHRCSDNENDVADAIRRVWRSALEPHIASYLRQLSPETTSNAIAMGVVVQPYRIFELAGLLFTQHPAAKLRDWFLLEYLNASPDKIVGGEVTPQRCRVSLHDGALLWEYRITDAPTLANSQLQRLIDYGMRMRRALGGDVDMEWGARDGDIIALQCRPATVSPWL